MKKSLIAAAVLAILSLPAMATQPGNNGNGVGGCGNGQQTNGCGTTGGTGGTGGAGGAGGSGTGVGIGIAGAAANAAAAAAAQANAGAAVVGSGNSSNTNSIKNTNNNTQGQQQGQAQGQTQSNRSTNTNTTGASTATTGAVKTGDNALTTGAVSVNVEGAKGDNTYVAAQERNPVATAYAAPLTASNGTCMGSSSAGGQGASIGLSFGTTWTDSSCDIRYDAEALRAAGLPLAAQARLCQKADIAKAMEAAGTPCPNKGGAKRAEAILNGTQVADIGGGSSDIKPTGPNWNDPFIRKLNGLPPLK
jgi:hypothetical protein